MDQKADISKINLSSMQDISTEPAPVNDISGRTRIGYYLTWGVLGIILLYLAVFFIILMLNSNRIDASEFLIKNYSSLADSSHTEQSKNLIQVISNEAKSYRDFWLNLNQMILLNMLLPVLTALLGYIFGSKEDKR